MNTRKKLSIACRRFSHETFSGGHTPEYVANAYSYKMLPVDTHGLPIGAEDIEERQLLAMMRNKFEPIAPQAESDGLRRAGFFVPERRIYPANVARRLKRAVLRAEVEYDRNGGRMFPVEFNIGDRKVKYMDRIPKTAYMLMVWKGMCDKLEKLANDGPKPLLLK